MGVGVREFVFVMVVVFGVLVFSQHMPSMGLVGMVFSLLVGLGVGYLFYPGARRGDARLLFVVSSFALMLSFGYELLSGFPIGQDVHDEVFVTRVFLMDPSAPVIGHHIYYTVKLLLSLYGSFSLVLGVPVWVVVKIAAAFVIGLIPVFLYLYVSRFLGVFGVADSGLGVFLGVLTVVAQASYLYTLHSTTKQAWASLFVLLIFYFLLEERVRAGAGVIVLFFLLTLGLVGYHYTLSLIYMGILIVSMILYGLLYSGGRRRSVILLEAKVLFLAWILWYVVLSQNLLVFLVSNLSVLFSFSVRRYYTPLSLLRPMGNPVTLLFEQVKLFLNLLILGGIVVGGYYGSRRIASTNRYMGLVLRLAVLSLVVFLFLEVTKLSSIGTGRIAYIHLLVLAPFYLYGVGLAAGYVFRRVLGRGVGGGFVASLALLIVFLRLVMVLDIPLFAASLITGPEPLYDLTNPFYNPYALARGSIDPVTLWTVNYVSRYVGERTVIGGDISLYNTESYAEKTYLLKTHTIYTYFEPHFFNKTLIGIIEKADYIVITRYNTLSNTIIGSITTPVKTNTTEDILNKRYNLVLNTRYTRIYT